MHSCFPQSTSDQKETLILNFRLKGNADKGLMYFIEVIKSSSDNRLTPGFAAIMCLWGRKYKIIACLFYMLLHALCLK